MANTKKVEQPVKLTQDVQNISNYFDEVVQKLDILAQRWEDESSYEDKEDYIQAYKNLFKQYSKVDVRMGKISSIKIQLNAEQVAIIRIGKTIKLSIKQPAPKTTKQSPITTLETNKSIISEEPQTTKSSLEFLTAISKLPSNLLDKVLAALKYYKVSGNQFVELRKTEQILKDLPGHKNYAIIDLTPENQRFEITDEKFSKVFRNKSCGSWKSIVNNEDVYVYIF